jgi:hypothetical protein
MNFSLYLNFFSNKDFFSSSKLHLVKASSQHFIMLWKKLIIVLGAFSVTTSATNMNLSCSNCLGNNQYNIRYGCYQICSSAFNATSSKYNYCRLTCSGFVFNDNCCTNTGTCSSNPNQYMNTFFPPSSSSKRDFLS